MGSKQAIWNGPCPLREPIKTHDLLSLAQGYYQPYSATVSLWLTTTSLHGGWMPETSRSLYYCQPAPIWRLLPWLANPGNPAKSPHARKGKLPGWWGTTSNNTTSSRSKHTKDCFKQRAHGIPMHAHMQKLLTTRERWCSLLLTLLNCSKLHLIKKTVVTIYKWVWQTSSYWNFLLLTITSSIPPLSPYFFSCWV